MLFRLRPDGRTAPTAPDRLLLRPGTTYSETVPAGVKALRPCPLARPGRAPWVDEPAGQEMGARRVVLRVGGPAEPVSSRPAGGAAYGPARESRGSGSLRWLPRRAAC